MPILTDFQPDAARLAVLKDCIDDYDVAEDTNAEWPNNILSRQTVVYPNGVIARAQDKISFATDSEELDLCVRLANEAAALMKGVEVGLGSESGAEFSAFWICANGQEKPARIDENFIKSRFGNTIFPPATIEIQELSTDGSWFERVRENFEEMAEDDADKADYWREEFGKCETLVRWFESQNAFCEAAFVEIGDRLKLWELPKEEYPPGTEITPCVLPVLLVGLTQNVSLAGLFGFVVQT